MVSEKLNRLQAFLQRYDSSLDLLPKTRIKQLELVDEAIMKRISATTSAKSVMKSNKISVSAVSADTNISRKTFYNNDFLRLYVEMYSNEESSANISSIEINRLKSINKELESRIRDFLLRDVETENLRQENYRLNEEIKYRDNQIQYIREQYEKSQEELLSIRKRLSSLPETVIHIPKNPPGQNTT